MSGHAHGPWWADESGIRNADRYIAFTNTVTHIREDDARYLPAVAEREADKKLIAAAPELLAALEASLNALQDYVYRLHKQGSVMGYGNAVIRQARAAIAKAEGQS